MIILEGGYPAAPTFTDAEVTEGLGMAYLKAVTVNAIRRGELRTAAVEIERRCSRLFWRAAGGAARGATTVIEPAGDQGSGAAEVSAGGRRNVQRRSVDRRLGWRDQHRPTGDRDTAVMLLAGGLRKSGAGELLQRSGYIVRTL